MCAITNINNSNSMFYITFYITKQLFYIMVKYCINLVLNHCIKVSEPLRNIVNMLNYSLSTFTNKVFESV